LQQKIDKISKTTYAFVLSNKNETGRYIKITIQIKPTSLPERTNEETYNSAKQCELFG
jgi:hypothetical protein